MNIFCSESLGQTHLVSKSRVMFCIKLFLEDVNATQFKPSASVNSAVCQTQNAAPMVPGGVDDFLLSRV